jgi:hypothetical protein
MFPGNEGASVNQLSSRHAAPLPVPHASPSRRLQALSAVLALAALPSLGCVAIIDEQRVRGTPYAAPERSPVLETERAQRSPRVEATAVGDAVDVKVTAPVECRPVVSTPMVREDTLERKMTGAYGFKSNESPQFWNVVGTALLAGGGGYLAFADCKDPDSGRPCSTGGAETTRDAGYVLLGLAGVGAAITLINGLRAIDLHETVPDKAERRPGPWAACGEPPLAGLEVALTLGDVHATSSTSANGHAVFDLTALDLSGRDVPNDAEITAAGVPAIVVDVAALPFRARWVAEQRAREHAARKATAASALAAVRPVVARCDATAPLRARRAKHDELRRSEEPRRYVQKRCTPRHDTYTATVPCKDANGFARTCTKQLPGDEIIGYFCPTTLDKDTVRLGLFQLGFAENDPFQDELVLPVTDAECEAAAARLKMLEELSANLDAEEKR